MKTPRLCTVRAPVWGRTSELDLRIGARFALSEAAEAHRALQGRKTTGKVVLLPG